MQTEHVLAEWNGRVYGATVDRFEVAIIAAHTQPHVLSTDDDAELHRFDDDGNCLM